MKARNIAKVLLDFPDFDVVFQNVHKDFQRDNVIADNWTDIEGIEIGHSEKIIVLTCDID